MGQPGRSLALLSKAREFQTLEALYWLFPLTSEVMAAEEMVSKLGGQNLEIQSLFSLSPSLPSFFFKRESHVSQAHLDFAL